MEQITEYLEEIFGIFVFCMAVSFVLLGATQVDNFVQRAKDTMNNVSTISITKIEEDINSEVELVHYSDIIAMLSGDIEYDMEVNGMYIQKENHNPNTFSFLTIPKRVYKKIYCYDGNGSILKIVYSIL